MSTALAIFDGVIKEKLKGKEALECASFYKVNGLLTMATNR
jgi:hypothetical protein